MTEEERAALHRQQCANRARWRAERAAALRGDPAAAQRVSDAYAPLRPHPEDSWDCLDPPDPPRPPWLGRIPGDIELPEHLKDRPDPGSSHGQQ